MSSSATEDGSPVWGRSLLAKEVRGIGESGSEEEFFVLSPSSIFDSERTKDFLVSVGEEGEVEDDGRWMPTMCRIVLTMPLNMEIDNTVFTRRTHNTPSDGAGRQCLKFRRSRWIYYRRLWFS